MREIPGYTRVVATWMVVREHWIHTIVFSDCLGFSHITVGETFQKEARAWVSGFLSTGFNEPLNFVHRGEKEERELTIYWLFNIYWVVTVIRDLGYFWTSTIFNENMLKPYTKCRLLLQAHVSSVQVGKQADPVRFLPPSSHCLS